jgi:hypothetical protein
LFFLVNRSLAKKRAKKSRFGEKRAKKKSEEIALWRNEIALWRKKRAKKSRFGEKRAEKKSEEIALWRNEIALWR